MTSYAYPIPSALAQMQKEAHCVVEASAGTGKTYLIEHRVVDLLVSGVCTMDQILIVTFTEKATAELRLRIRRLIERVRGYVGNSFAVDSCPSTANTHFWTIDKAARLRLSEALFHFDQSAIYTIHGFCHRLRAEHAFCGNRLLEEAQVASDVAFASVFKGAMREVFAREYPYRAFLSAWLSSGRTMDFLQAILFRCVEQGGQLSPNFCEQALVTHLRAGCQEITGLCASLEGALRGVRAGTARAIRERLDVIDKTVAAYQQHQSVPQFLGELDQVRRYLFPYLLDKLGEVHNGDCRLQALAQYITTLESLAVPLVVAIAQQFVPVLRERLVQEKARAGLFDFRDMLSHTWQALSGSGGDGLASRLRSRYRHILIDEFQDTDELQWKIFRKICLEGSSGSYLSVIGDPKQAIYGFRGADVFVYLAAKKELLESNAVHVNLVDNYRSTRAMVQVINTILSEANPFSVPFFGQDIAYQHPVQAAAKVEARCQSQIDNVPLHLMDVRSFAPETSAELIRTRIGQFIASEIRRVISQPASQIVLQRAGEDRVLFFQDVFVLTRSLAESNEIAAILRNEGLPCALYKHEGLFQTEEALEVRDLLLGIARPDDQSARFRAWQSRFFGVELGELSRLAQLSDQHALVTRLYDWKRIADRLDYEQLFATIIAESGVMERALLLSSSERSITNFLHIFESLAEEASRLRGTVEELARRLQSWIEDESENRTDKRSIQRLESDRDAVQIMTIHKAKGLECGILFLYGGGSGVVSQTVSTFHQEGTRYTHVGPLRGTIKQKVQAEAQAEEQRLLYVAMTRAIARLYLPLRRHSPKSRLGTHYELNHRLTELADSNAMGVRIRSVEEYTPATVATHCLSDALAKWVPPDRLLEPPAVCDDQLTRIREQRRGFVVSSYTRMKARTRPRNIETPARSAPSEMPGGATVGVFLHKLLELVPFESVVDAADFDAWCEQDHVDRLFRSTIVRYQQSLEHLRHSQGLIYRALTDPVVVDEHLVIPSIAALERSQREFEFQYRVGEPHCGRAGGYIRGYMDLMFFHQGRVYVLDWKSDVLEDYQSKSLAGYVAEHYQLQADVYALAIAKMLGLTGTQDYDSKFGGVVYAFLRGSRGKWIYFDRPAYDRVHTFQQSLMGSGGGLAL